MSYGYDKYTRRVGYYDPDARETRQSQREYSEVLNINGFALYSDDQTGIVVSDVGLYELEFLKLGEEGAFK